MKSSIYFIGIALLMFSCNQSEVVVKSAERSYTYLKESEAPVFEDYQDVYVSAYSNLYYMDGSKKIFYTVILSLRNISYTDTLYFNKVNYLNSRGDLIRSYLKESVLVLHPMESLEYIVEQTESQGGAGANFIVGYGSSEGLKNKPVIEAVTTGTISHHGFAFKVDGVEIVK